MACPRPRSIPRRRCSTPGWAWIRSTRWSWRWRSASATASSCARTATRTGASSLRCGRCPNTSSNTERLDPDPADRAGGGLRGAGARCQRPRRRAPGVSGAAGAGGADAGGATAEAAAVGVRAGRGVHRRGVVAARAWPGRAAAVAGAGGVRGPGGLGVRAQPAPRAGAADHPHRVRPRRRGAGAAAGRRGRLCARPDRDLGRAAGRNGTGQPGAGDAGHARRAAGADGAGLALADHPRTVVVVRQPARLWRGRRIFRARVPVAPAPLPGAQPGFLRLPAPARRPRAGVLAGRAAMSPDGVHPDRLHGDSAAAGAPAGDGIMRNDCMGPVSPEEAGRVTAGTMIWRAFNMLQLAIGLVWTAAWITLALLLRPLSGPQARLPLRMAA